MTKWNTYDQPGFVAAFEAAPLHLCWHLALDTATELLDELRWVTGNPQPWPHFRLGVDLLRCRVERRTAAATHQVARKHDLVRFDPVLGSASQDPGWAVTFMLSKVHQVIHKTTDSLALARWPVWVRSAVLGYSRMWNALDSQINLALACDRFVHAQAMRTYGSAYALGRMGSGPAAWSVEALRDELADKLAERRSDLLGWQQRLVNLLAQRHDQVQNELEQWRGQLEDDALFG